MGEFSPSLPRQRPHLPCVGVAQQYLGCFGKTDNGQVIVSLHLCAGDFDLPGTAEVFLPEKGWGGSDEACQQRRAAAKVPEDWVLRTKPELALLLRVRAWGLTLRRVYADAGYAALGMMPRLAALGFRAGPAYQHQRAPCR